MPDRLTIDRAGNVGIGTTSPSSELEVTGEIRATNPGSSPEGSWISLSSPAGDVGVILTRGDGAGGAAQRWDLKVGDDSSFRITDVLAGNLDRFTLDIFGNVGIGTASPGEKLFVQGEIRFGASAEHYPPAYDRKTVIVAGKITQQGDIDSSVTTSNAIDSAVRNSTGSYTVTFVTGTFTSKPIVTVTPWLNDMGEVNRRAVITGLSLTHFRIKISGTGGNEQNAPFNFIAIGER